MPKNINKELGKKVLHPRSRKAQKLARQVKRVGKIEKIKMVHYVKLNLVGEKLLWFKQHLEPNTLKYTPEMTIKIIEQYLSRFDEELEQIQLKHSIGKRKNRQHANREDIIKLTKLHEEEEFTTCGFEIPDLLSPEQLKMLREWEGEIRYLQNFKLKRYNRQELQKLQELITKRQTSSMPGTRRNSVSEDMKEPEEISKQNDSESKVNEENEKVSVDNDKSDSPAVEGTAMEIPS